MRAIPVEVAPMMKKLATADLDPRLEIKRLLKINQPKILVCRFYLLLNIFAFNVIRQGVLLPKNSRGHFYALEIEFGLITWFGFCSFGKETEGN